MACGTSLIGGQIREVDQEFCFLTSLQGRMFDKEFVLITVQGILHAFVGMLGTSWLTGTFAEIVAAGSA